MSDVSSVSRKSGSSSFPIIRKSIDPLQPQSAEVEFSQALEQFDQSLNSAVQETEKSDQPVVKEDGKGKGQRELPKNERSKEEEEEDDTGPDDVKRINLEV